MEAETGVMPLKPHKANKDCQLSPEAKRHGTDSPSMPPEGTNPADI